MRGGGGYDVQMTNAGDGYWVTDVPLAAGANQYWFYVDNNTNLWVADPANSPIYAPDGLTGTARRAFNKVYVPYDAEKQNYAPLGGPADRAPSAERAARHVELRADPDRHDHADAGRLPARRDTTPNRAEPYKTIYMQHGSGQDQSDWMNMGDVPVIMDNLLQDGLTEPAIVITTNTNYLGSSRTRGTPTCATSCIPFVESNYNVSTQREGPGVRRSVGGRGVVTVQPHQLRRHEVRVLRGVERWRSASATPRRTSACPTSSSVAGAWDFGLPNPNAGERADQRVTSKNVVVAGAHDFNAWNQLFTTFARDYLWQRGAFVNGAPVFAAGGESQSVDENRKLTFTVAATDPDGDALTYSADGLPAGATFDPATRQFSWTPGLHPGGHLHGHLHGQRRHEVVQPVGDQGR